MKQRCEDNSNKDDYSSLSRNLRIARRELDELNKQIKRRRNQSYQIDKRYSLYRNRYILRTGVIPEMDLMKKPYTDISFLLKKEEVEEVKEEVEEVKEEELREIEVEMDVDGDIVREEFSQEISQEEISQEFSQEYEDYPDDYHDDYPEEYHEEYHNDYPEDYHDDYPNDFNAMNDDDDDDDDKEFDSEFAWTVSFSKPHLDNPQTADINVLSLQTIDS